MKSSGHIGCVLAGILVIGVPSSCGTRPSDDAAPQRLASEGGAAAMRIEVLTIPGCQVTPPTIDLVTQTADEMGASYELEVVTITDNDLAQQHRFTGSPTVRVNGVDIDPDALAQDQYGVTWRRYGASGMPTKEMVQAALKKAREPARKAL